MFTTQKFEKLLSHIHIFIVFSINARFINNQNKQTNNIIQDKRRVSGDTERDGHYTTWFEPRFLHSSNASNTLKTCSWVGSVIRESSKKTKPPTSHKAGTSVTQIALSAQCHFPLFEVGTLQKQQNPQNWAKFRI